MQHIFELFLRVRCALLLLVDATPAFLEQMVTWQIVSGLGQAHKFRGGGEYPYPFNYFVNVIEFVMFDFFAFFNTSLRTQYKSGASEPTIE